MAKLCLLVKFLLKKLSDRDCASDGRGRLPVFVAGLRGGDRHLAFAFHGRLIAADRKDFRAAAFEDQLGT